MAKRNFATIIVCLASICGPGAGNAQAQQALSGAEGCTALGELVATELALSRWFGVGSTALLPSGAGRSDINICYQTARTVTGAFTAALAGMNIEVRWGYYPPHPGDYCMSGDLSQCYPDRYPLSTGTIGGRYFVADSWRAVQQTVTARMQLGTASDTSRFSPHGLSTALGRALEQNRSGVALDYQQGILSAEH